VLPLDEFSVMIPEQHATLQGVRISSAIFENRFSPYLFNFNAVWALTSGGFRIASDTLVIIKPPLATSKAAICNGLVHLFVCLFVCLSVCRQIAKKAIFYKKKLSNLELCCLLTTYRKS